MSLKFRKCHKTYEQQFRRCRGHHFWCLCPGGQQSLPSTDTFGVADFGPLPRHESESLEDRWSIDPVRMRCDLCFSKTRHFDPFCPYTFSLLCCCLIFPRKRIIRSHPTFFPAICLKEDGGCSTGLLWDHMAMAAAAMTTTKWWSIAVGSELQGVSKTEPMKLTGKNLATLKVENGSNS